MQWLCIHLPQLAIDLLHRSGVTERCFAVLESRGSKRWIHAANALARSVGIRSGMNLAAAYALAPELVAYPRNHSAECKALEQTALAAYGFSDRVSAQPPDCVVVEIARSRRLLRKLDIPAALRTLHFQFKLAIAPTPKAALLLCRAGRYGEVESTSQLNPLPLHHSGLDPGAIDTLHDAGIRTLGDLRRLPRAGLNRRFGSKTLAYLDRLLGRTPDPLDWFEPPEHFESRLELPQETAYSEPLIFAASRLLGELEMFLEVRGLAARELGFHLDHSDAQTTCLKVGLLEPSRNRVRLLDLFRERIGQTNLRAPVRSMTLKVVDLDEFEVRNGDLFDPASAGTNHHWARLLERLRSRLGEEAIRHLAVTPDHRPERAWRACRRPAEQQLRPVAPPRPLWLLAEPHRLRADDLQLLDGPERIESGWWDDGDVARDYYVAVLEDNRRVWIFRDCRSHQWFVHGLFG